MHRLLPRALVLLLATATPAAIAQRAAPAPAAEQRIDNPFTFERVMIPMRDGTRLATVILRPRGVSGPLPILFQRSPYGIPTEAPASISMSGGMGWLYRDRYIVVYQSMRGRFGSEGTFTLSTAVHPNDPRATDESTDAYDTIDWLVHHVPDNNGRVGMWGISYPGFAAAIALAHPHPALKAVSPQAAWIDYWQNDDLHRNGALRLSYATDWVSSLQLDPDQNTTFQYGTYDTYDWFLARPNVASIDRDFFHGRVPMFTALVEHPNHDSFYTGQRWSDTLRRTTVPTLNVAGYWDQEDPWGSWQIYERQERDDPQHLNSLVVGPWNHGGWARAGDMLGPIPVGRASGTEFQDQIQAPFFRYWLHQTGPRPDIEVRSFQSGSWTWRSYHHWPPAGAHLEPLYLNTDGTLTLDVPSGAQGCRSYVSDPANPVPFRRRPMSGTYVTPDWRTWESDDQRFLQGRPDVLTWTSGPLLQDLTVTGDLAATLMASTSGTDSDFVVKLIDVYPDNVTPVPATSQVGDYARSLNGYQLPIAMEVRRGRFLDSDTTPHALVPDQVRAWEVPLRPHDHVFKAGHRIMIQVQSSWFPVIDRNPQTFTPNISTAPPEAFRAATQRVCSGSRISLPVMREWGDPPPPPVFGPAR